MKYYKESDIRGARFKTISNPFSQGWNDGIDSILENATPIEIPDMDPAPEAIPEGGNRSMNYNKRSARELYDGVVRQINDLRIDMARIDGQLAALDRIRVDLYGQMMAEKHEQEETNGQQTH